MYVYTYKSSGRNSTYMYMHACRILSPLSVSRWRVPHFGVAGMHWRQSQCDRGRSSRVLVGTRGVCMCVGVCMCSGGRSFGPGAPGPGIGGCDRAAAVLALFLPFFGSLLPAWSVSCGSGSCGGSRGCCCWSLLLHLQHSLCGLVWSLPKEPSQPLATLNANKQRTVS